MQYFSLLFFLGSWILDLDGVWLLGSIELC